MLSISDYLKLIEIKNYFSEEIDKKESENNVYESDYLNILRSYLLKIINKLEKEY